MYRKILLYPLGLLILFTSCKKFLDVGNPPDKVAARFVYQYNTSATAVLTGIYFDLQKISQGKSSISFFCGLSADELNVLPLSAYKAHYSNNSFPDFWTPLYGFVYRINAALEGLSATVSLTPAVQQQLLGEARFLRAFCYFYLVNFYGDVPLLTTTDYTINAKAARLSKEKVYAQIIDDLLKAQSLLSDSYLNADVVSITDERVRPNKWAASAMLARVYLYTGKWSAAELEASSVIAQKTMFDTVSLNEVFIKNSKETIWQLQSISDDGTFLNTQEAILYILVRGKPDAFRYPVWTGNTLLEAFESGDQRQEDWLGIASSGNNTYYYPFKYKVYQRDDPPTSTEYLMVLRLAEQYLIRAEARAQQGDIAGAQSDLNVIRHRARLMQTTASTKEMLINVILHERQVELFTEWGHRWLDLKRTGKINDVMGIETPKKEGIWESYKQWYPIPLRDLQYNLNLIQNEGYPSS